MVKRKIVEAIDKQERIKRRKELGKLGNLVIRPATADRYEKAFQKFLSFLTSQKLAIGSQKTIVDSQLSSFLENLWEEGESISLAGDFISAVQHYQPSMRKHLPQSWRLLKTWQQHELPARAPPFTVDTLQVLLGWFHKQEPRVALALFLAFRCLLRTGEMLSISAQDIIIPPGSLSGVLYLGDTKTSGRNPHAGTVALTDPSLVLFFKSWKQTVSPSTCLVPWSSTKFRTMFQEGLIKTGLSKLQFKPYSLRRGGATDQWLLTKNYAHVAHLGRWATEKTMKIYIQDSIALLTSLSFHPSSIQKQFITYWNQICRVEPMTKSHTGGGRGRKTK